MTHTKQQSVLSLYQRASPDYDGEALMILSKYTVFLGLKCSVPWYLKYELVNQSQDSPKNQTNIYLHI